MKLLQFECKLFGDNGTNDWSLERINLHESINLLVGQNATGKSRVAHCIKAFTELIAGYDEFDGLLGNYSKFEWSCMFKKSNGDIINYFVLFDYKRDLMVKDEILELNNKLLLKRKNGNTELFSFTFDKFIKISPPDDKLVLHVRRDKEEFPFFEDIVRWAEQGEMVEFAGENSGKNLASWFEDLNSNSIENLKKDFNQLGYKLKDVFLKKNKYSDSKFIHVLEEGLKKSVIETDLSQGMSRALDLLTYLQYLLQSEKTSIFILDDLGEGLDYERSTKLSKLLLEKIENSNIQLIATSNDSFLMDVIPIKYWNILEREGNIVKSYNYQNSKEAFDAFKMSGLSNFYLFTSDFLHQKL